MKFAHSLNSVRFRTVVSVCDMSKVFRVQTMLKFESDAWKVIRGLQERVNLRKS